MAIPREAKPIDHWLALRNESNGENSVRSPYAEPVGLKVDKAAALTKIPCAAPTVVGNPIWVARFGTGARCARSVLPAQSHRVAIKANWKRPIVSYVSLSDFVRPKTAVISPRLFVTRNSFQPRFNISFRQAINFSHSAAGVRNTRRSATFSQESGYGLSDECDFAMGDVYQFLVTR